jgi:hypothetical protein
MDPDFRTVSGAGRLQAQVEKIDARNRNRLFWSLLSKISKDWKSELILVKPETVIPGRERKFRDFWRKKSRNMPGGPAISKEHIEFIRQISSDHPEYGEDRSALE